MNSGQCVMLVWVLIVMMTGCGAPSADVAGGVEGIRGARDVAGSVAKGITESAGRIDTYRLAAVAKAPAVRPESDGIGEETAAIRRMSGELAAARTALDLAEADGRAVVKERDALLAKGQQLEQSLAKARAEKNSLLTRLLAGIAAAAVVGAVVCAFCRQLWFSLMCAGVVVAAIGATWLNEHRALVGMALGGVLLVAAVVVAWIQRRAVVELVKSFAIVKPVVKASPAAADMRAAVLSAQSDSTIRLVDAAEQGIEREKAWAREAMDALIRKAAKRTTHAPAPV